MATATATAMGLEEVQEDLIRHFSERAAKLMPSQEGSLPLAAAAALGALVLEATSHAGLFDYSRLLCLQAISWLRGTQYRWCVDALGIFAHGTLKDYNRHKNILPPLSAAQLSKLKDLTLLTSLEARQMVPYADLMEELNIPNIAELEAYLMDSGKKLGIRGMLRMQSRMFEVFYCPKIHGSLTCGQSLEVYLQAATVCHLDAQTGILSNEISTQVKVPLSRCGRHFCWKVDFKPRGSEIFIQLIGLTSDGHLSHRSWNGLIYPGMFGILRGRIFLRPGAAACQKICDQSSMNDYGSIDHMIKCYAGLRFQHRDRTGRMQQVMYPIYVDDLSSHLMGMKPRLSSSKIRALDLNFIAFLKCHPSLLNTSARSVVFFHVRKEHKSLNSNAQKNFSAMLRSVNTNNWKKKLRFNWLFEHVFHYAISHGCQYKNNATDCHRCIRDWETHCREHLTDDERRLFTTVVLTYLVEHHFDNFFPEILYVLLCSPPNANLDLVNWLSKLQRISPNDTPNAVQGHQSAN